MRERSEKLLEYIKSNKHCLWLIYWPIHFIWYQALRIIFADSDVLLLHSALDDKIPFCEWFFIPYVMWYIGIPTILFYSLYHGKREFLRSNFLIIGSLILPMVFCTLVPNGIDVSMRPDFETLGRDNFATDIVKLIYAADEPPRNCCPSMHVSVAFAFIFSVLQLKPLKGKWALKTAVTVLCIAIALSTVFIKQHSIIDVYAGIATAVIVFVIVRIAEKLHDRNKKENV